MIWRIIERTAQQQVSGVRHCQLAIERHVVPLLLAATLGVVGVLLPTAAQSQDLAPATPEIPLAPNAVANAMANDWQPAGPAPTPEDIGIKAIALTLFEGVKHLPAKENAFWAAAGGAGAFVVHTEDTKITAAFANASWTDNFFELGEVLGAFRYLVPVSVGVYAIGRATRNPKASHTGMDLIASVVLSQAIVKTIKVATQRERPDGSDRLSFPSGHAADTFAFATALERHLGWRGAVPGYIFSSYVAISRVNDKRHFMSDVVFGSTVGIIAARTVTRPNREFPLTVMLIPGGAAITYAHRSE